MNKGTDQRFTRASSRINMNAQSTRKARNYDFVIAGNMAEQPVMKHLPHRISGSLDNSRMIMRSSFFFGNHTGIGEQEREYIAGSIIDFVKISSKR